MSRKTEKALHAFHKFMAEKAPQGAKDGEELQRLIQEFFAAYNETLANGADGTDEMDMYDYLELADQSSSKHKKKQYLEQAAALAPDNMDVKLAQLEVDTKSPLDFVAALPELIETERNRLKREQLYTNNRGDFWMVFETRPYMRLLQRYMMALMDCGIFIKAIEVGETMMGLNKNDNLGIRYTLMVLYAKTSDETKALKLYHINAGEADCPSYLLPLSLLYFKLGKWDTAKSYLMKLKETCPGTKKFIRAVKKGDIETLLRTMYSPGGYTIGTAEELVDMYLDHQLAYEAELFFFEWADEALIVHRKKK